MNFYFCEACGKRVSEADLAQGLAQDKKLKGVYCVSCAAGVRTMETIPIKPRSNAYAAAYAESASKPAPVSISEAPPRPAAEPAPARPNRESKPVASDQPPPKLPWGLILGGSISVIGLVLAALWMSQSQGSDPSAKRAVSAKSESQPEPGGGKPTETTPSPPIPAAPRSPTPTSYETEQSLELLARASKLPPIFLQLKVAPAPVSNEALNTAIQNARSALERGMKCENAANFPGALAEYEAALVQDPRSDSARAFRGHVRALQGDLKGALEDVDKALEWEPEVKCYAALKAILLGALENDAEFKIMLNRATQGAAQRNYEICIRQEVQAAQQSALGRALEGKDITGAVDLFCRGYFRLALGRSEDGQRDLANAQKLDSHLVYHPLLFKYSWTGFANQDPRRCMVLRQRMAEAAPNNGRALEWYANELLSCADQSLRDYSGGLLLAERAVQLDHRNQAEFLDILAMAYFHLGRFQEAVDAQREALDKTKPIYVNPIMNRRTALRNYEAALSKSLARP